MDTCLFLNFSKLCKVCLRLVKLDITHFTRVSPLGFLWISRSRKNQRGILTNCLISSLFNIYQTLHILGKLKLKSLVAPPYWFAKVEILNFDYYVIFIDIWYIPVKGPQKSYCKNNMKRIQSFEYFWKDWRSTHTYECKCMECNLHNFAHNTMVEKNTIIYCWWLIFFVENLNSETLQIWCFLDILRDNLFHYTFQL